MEYKEKEIQEGIKVHIINTENFKTNLISVFLTTELNSENVTKNSLVSAVLRRGSKTMKTQEEISKQMEDMYGASFDCGLDKTGDNQVLKFYIETLNDKFLPHEGENLLKKSLEKLFEIVFNPLIEKESFKDEYVEQEKNNVKQRIEGKIDNKARYALDRCIEEMYKNEPFGLYKFGYIEDLEKIDCKNLYEYYKKLISNCKIDIFISGTFDNKKIENEIFNNKDIIKLAKRNAKYNKLENQKRETKEENIVIESMDVSQGKLVLGLNVNIEDEDLKYDVMIYNSILGGTANSKMFQNVREKANLAYVASSSYLRYKNNIFINCGIEIKNYEKALELIRLQIQDMEKGNFSEVDIENAKKGIIANIKTIEDEQDTGISYYFGQEMTNKNITLQEYIDRINKVTKESIVNVAKNISIDTIYFLKNN